MATEREYQNLSDLVAALRQQLTKDLAPDLSQNPQLAEVLVQRIDNLFAETLRDYKETKPPADNGLANLIGIGSDVATELADSEHRPDITEYDDTVVSNRIIAVADLYYIYQHERIGVFRVVQKLQELFRAGSVRLSGEQGALGLYRFDRKQVLRYTRHDRLAAYRRAFGYGSASVPPGSRPNSDFHNLFSHFINQVALFWRDKRISDVIRERALDPSFGSIATVRRAGQDLRHNLKFASYGHLNVLRIEVRQLLDEAFRILEADDVRRLFGAENAWDVVEEVLVRYFNENLATSPRQRMAITGQKILGWLAQNYIRTTTRAEFETHLRLIAEDAEEWLTSAQALGIADRRASATVIPMERRTVAASNGRRTQPDRRRSNSD